MQGATLDQWKTKPMDKCSPVSFPEQRNLSSIPLSFSEGPMGWIDLFLIEAADSAMHLCLFHVSPFLELMGPWWWGQRERERELGKEEESKHVNLFCACRYALLWKVHKVFMRFSKGSMSSKS